MRKSLVAKHLRYLLAFCSICIVGSDIGMAQTLPVGDFSLEDYYRRKQLTDSIAPTLSFSTRPVNLASFADSTDVFNPEGRSDRYAIKGITETGKLLNGKGTLQLLPFSMQLKLASSLPYGWNDGPMIPAAGLQTYISAGIYAKYGPLSIQFKPELVMAENQNFPGFAKDHYEVIWARYYDYYNNIDLPERFGKGAYSRAYWGQSSIKLTFDPVSFGFSTENLWWGPGMRNSLLMSNSAPGFKHFSLNTSRPALTGIGSFEGQLIAGRPEASGYTPLTPDKDFFGYSLYDPKPNDTRYMSGLNITWQPKWVPGLFLGISRIAQLYARDMMGVGDYIPVFLPFKNTKTDASSKERMHISSVYLRWLWPEEHSEIYFEYGRNDFSYSLRDLVMEPERSRAYTFGLRKLFPFRGRDEEYLGLNLEVTQLQQTSFNTVRNAGAWYVDRYMRHGYTNRGQMIGAGIGPGSDLQSIQIGWYKGLKHLGVQVERFIHNNDFYYYAYEDSQDWRRHWTDLSVSVNGELNYKNFIFNASLQTIKSLNYQWYLLQTDFNNYFTNGRDKSNVVIQGGFTYRF